MMKKVLSISYSKPNLSSPHAGGKTYSYYMKSLSESDEIELTIVCLCENANDTVDFESFRAKGYRLFRKGSLFFNIKRAWFDLYGMLFNKNPIDSYFKLRQYENKILDLSNEGYSPDVIILEWTQCVILASYCKKVFPNAKILASEHDVSYLGYQRRYLTTSSNIKRNLAIKKYIQVKKQELDALNICDLIMPHNNKDRDLLIADGIESNKIMPIVPYYSHLFNIDRRCANKDILFWGAMNREENSAAALWFIDNVMPLLPSNFRFVVVGNKPPQKLIERKTNNIVITGFVDDPSVFFERSLCMVVPLLNGAGIKVKVIESLSAALPVLTNNVGIEGIPAKDEYDYLNCQNPDDYYNSILRLANDDVYARKIGNNGRKLIERYFDLKQSRNQYITAILKG